MQLQFNISSKKRVACSAHLDCPMLEQKPPTVATCWEHVVLPGIFRPRDWFELSEKKQKAIIAEYYTHQGVPGYTEEAVSES